MTRLPPHDEQAERAVLGAMLRDPDACVPLVLRWGLVRETLFFHHHQLLFGRMVELFNRDRGLDLAALYVDLRRRGELVELPHWHGSLWLAELHDVFPWQWPGCDDAVLDVWHTQPFCEACLEAAVAHLRWLAVRRSAIHAASELLRDASDGHLCPDDERLALVR